METRDLSLAAALLTSGEKLEAVDAEGNHAIFRFAESPNLDMQVRAFHSRTLMVNAAQYGECMRSLKSAAMSARQMQGTRS